MMFLEQCSDNKIDTLLDQILQYAIEFTNADAGTLYIKKDLKLYFHLAKNTSLAVQSHQNIQNELKNYTLCLESKQDYVSVEAANSQNIINIPDVYASREFNFTGTKTFDEMLGYKTHSMLVIPIINKESNETICVIQLLNKLDKDGSFIAFTQNDEKTVKMFGKISAIAITEVNSYIQKLEDLNQSLEFKVRNRTKKLQKMTETDFLTGINNRRRFFNVANELFEDEFNENLIVCIADIDKFKAINDTYGHLAGDEVLKQFAQLIEGLILPDTVFARIGGEEFGLVYSGYPLTIVAQNLELIRVKVSEMTVGFGELNIRLTASFGYAMKTVSFMQIDDVLEKADIALYEAKKQGRNRVNGYKEESIHVHHQNKRVEALIVEDD